MNVRNHQDSHHIAPNMVSLSELAEWQCWLALFLFTFIATASRNPRLEILMQHTLMWLCLVMALTLSLMWFDDQSMWGRADPRPLAVMCVIIAISARLNLHGKNVSFGANPHTIGKSEESE